MKQSNKEKGKGKKARIDELRKELSDKDEIVSKNVDKLEQQVYIALRTSSVLVPGSPMQNSLIEQMRLDLKEEKIKEDTEFRVVNPAYEFQTKKEWVDIQKERSSRHIKALTDAITELEQKIEEVKNKLIAQNAQIAERRIGIIEELKELKNDVSDIQKPNYIG